MEKVLLSDHYSALATNTKHNSFEGIVDGHPTQVDGDLSIAFILPWFDLKSASIRYLLEDIAQGNVFEVHALGQTALKYPTTLLHIPVKLLPLIGLDLVKQGAGGKNQNRNKNGKDSDCFSHIETPHWQPETKFVVLDLNGWFGAYLGIHVISPWLVPAPAAGNSPGVGSTDPLIHRIAGNEGKLTSLRGDFS
jgi:hypothetical protein